MGARAQALTRDTGRAMSKEDVERLRELCEATDLEAWSRGEADLSLLDPALLPTRTRTSRTTLARRITATRVWSERRNWLDPTVRAGDRSSWTESWGGPTASSPSTESRRGRDTPTSHSTSQLAYLWTFRAGKVIHFQSFRDPGRGPRSRRAVGVARGAFFLRARTADKASRRRAKTASGPARPVGAAFPGGTRPKPQVASRPSPPLLERVSAAKVRGAVSTDTATSPETGPRCRRARPRGPHGGETLRAPSRDRKLPADADPVRPRLSAPGQRRPPPQPWYGERGRPWPLCPQAPPLRR